MSDVFQHRSIHEADHIEALQQQIRELQAENRSIRESLQDRRDRETNPDTRDYLLAMTGEGPQANNWADKPHRLVYDLINKVTAITRQRDDARDLAVRSGIFESVESTRPTLESARVVVETLRDENTRLLEQVRALTAANEDLNAELISLRRSLLDERDREGCE